ncbi:MULTISPECIES: biotin synthase BioB [Gammaproteobacteria]|nr:biotin synthase BioB [Lysobacter sp. N42]RTE87797.1 biotin synthase BioB [Aliidiomarina sp. B3213]TCZ93433.1 biotin synthase BioB [Lysobacter sp. N42]
MTVKIHDPNQVKWSKKAISDLFALPFNDLLFKAHQTHREYFAPNEVQVSTLLSIKTGACPEDCKYCPQSARYNTELEKEALMEVQQVLEQAHRAKQTGATRFCMGAAWRNPKDRDMPKLRAMIEGVREMGMETCMTLGMLSAEQATELASAGLDYYNHNIDTAPEFYGDIITTRTFQDRLDTLDNVRSSGMKVCSGGIVGLGEEQSDRVLFISALANMETPPESVPINMLVKVAGTPMENVEDIDPFDFIRTIAVARITMPNSHVRLSAGRESMSDELQALAFFAGANSIFYGEKLLTTANPVAESDQKLFQRLGIKPEAPACNSKQSEEARDEAHA